MSGSSFWEAEDKIPISQKSVSVPSQNGLEYSGGQRVVIEIPKSVEYIQPKESYLKFDVKLKLPTEALAGGPTFLQLDEILGGQALLKDVRIYSGGAGKILLEEYQDYNVLTNVKYTYETNDVLRAKRALTEGATCHSVQNRATLGTTESHKNSIETNPYFNQPGYAPANVLADADFQTVQCLLPLNTGLFSSAKVLPVLLTEGLVIDIILEEPGKVMRMLDQARKSTRMSSKCIFHSRNGNIVGGETPWPVDTPVTSIFVTADNSISGQSKVPFCIGEHISFVRRLTRVADAGAGANIVLEVGEEIPLTQSFVIDQINAPVGGLVEIVFSNAGGNYGESTVALTPLDYFLVSHAAVTDNWNTVSYTISNVEMVIQQLQMPQGYTQKMMSMMKEGGSMNYDFLSSTNYKYSQLSSDIVANIRLPLNMTRAKAILSVPTDATTYKTNQRIGGIGTYESYKCITTSAAPQVAPSGTNVTPDFLEASDKSGLVGISDFLTEYQFFYDGKLNPSRKVSCSETSSQVSISQQPLIELEKALVMSGIVPFSFRDYQNNFVIGRALSLHNGVYNTQGKDFNLQLEYSGSNANLGPATLGNNVPSKNKLWHNWVAHLRRIVFRGDGISLEV